ncbi:MAG: glycoside hydrolase family 127 protein, partial [Lachnospiraceae bacterium]|nr:glycoside hydrolase family 127 protein [Lachnospiraceae bacterium]
LVNLFIQSSIKIQDDERDILIIMDCSYPGESNIAFEIENNGSLPAVVKIRIPAWCDRYRASFDGDDVDVNSENGYWCITISPGRHSAALIPEIVPKRWYCNPKVSENIGRVAVERGPFVYCAESVDNGEDLHLLKLPVNSFLDYTWCDDLLEGVGVIEAEGIRLKGSDDNNNLYMCDKPQKSPQKIRLIPYYAWANRGENEMRVWINEGL